MSEHGWTPPTGGPGGEHPPPAGGPWSGAPDGRPPVDLRKGPGAGSGAGPGRPGIIPLRPLRLGEIWDGAFQAVRTNPRTILGPTLAVVLATTIASTAASATTLDEAFGDLGAAGTTGADLTADVATLLGPVLVSSLVTLVGTGLLAGMITLAVSGAVLGRRMRAGELWSRVRGRLPALVLLTLVTGVLLVLAVVVALLPGVVLAVVGGTTGGDGLLVAGVVLVLLGSLVAVAGYVALDTRLFLAAPVLVLEGAGVGAALRRAWALSRRGFWRLLGIRLLTVVLLGVVSTVFSLPFQAVGAALGFVAGTGADPGLLALATLAPSAVGAVLVGLVVYPLQSATTALQYTDQRMRQEGLDLELARAADAR